VLALQPSATVRHRWPRLAALDPSRVTLSALLVSLALAPLVFHRYDVMECLLPWSRATAGWLPWRVYDPGLPVACDYPPFIPYLLTLVEAGRRLLGAGEEGAIAVILLKLPAILAWLALVPLCLTGLREPFGPHEARLAAVCSAISLPLWINAALWGQWDALVTLFVAATVIALLNERPLLAGLSLGLALATKLLAVMALPIVGVWAWRRFGPRRTLLSGVAGALVVVALAVPHMAAGAGRQVTAAYTAAVGAYPLRTAHAYNGWYLLDRFDVHVRGMLFPEDRLDSQPAVGRLSFRDLGLIGLAGYTLFLMLVVWRRPTPDALVVGVALAFFAFFMLPTESRERYIVHASAFIALAVGRSRRAAVLFLGLAATATLNQGLELTRAVLDHARTADAGLAAHLGPGAACALPRGIAPMVALANVMLFVGATVSWRRLFGLGCSRP
jgi:hypothetical protein